MACRGGQHFGGDNSGNGISGVVKPVTVFENNRREDNDEKREHRGSRLGVLEDNLQNDVAGVPTAIDHSLE